MNSRDKEIYDMIIQICKKNDVYDKIKLFKQEQVVMGYKVEQEHNTGKWNDVVKSKFDIIKILSAHLDEDPNYYTKLKKVEGEVRRECFLNKEFKKIISSIPRKKRLI